MTGQSGPSGQSSFNASSFVNPGAGYSPITISGGEASSGPQVQGASGAYQPPQLSNTDGANTLVTQPTSSGLIGHPLYARPTPDGLGQFQLFTRAPPQPSEFEKFVEKTVGKPLPRFGESLILKGNQGFSVPSTTTAPPDYRLNPGDQLMIGVTGSVEGDLQVTINSEGKIFIPKIGAIDVAGVRYGDLQAALARGFGDQYKQAHISVVIGQLHGITVYVTGYAVTPGAYTVSSLSTLVDAVLAAGGPSSGGSFRYIELRRNGQLVTSLDLYQLLLKGDKSHDTLLQNQDVINIEPVGPELAVTGSVNDQAIFEAKAGETVSQVLSYAGGFNSLADDTRVVVDRLSDLDNAGSVELSPAQTKTSLAEQGEIIRVLSLGDISRPRERHAVLVAIDGEVNHPGRYYLPAGATLSELVAKAGGFSSGAFIYGAKFYRESVKQQEVVELKSVYDQLELNLAVAPLTAINSGLSVDSTGATNTAEISSRQRSTLQILNVLRQREPDGRLVLNLNYSAPSLPGGLALEDNDRITIPPRPTTVGVFGAVFQPGSFLFGTARSVSDYLNLAGGPQRYADRGEIFVVHADGALVSTRQKHHLSRTAALPGDLIFVPIRSSPSPFVQFRQIVSVIYQLGLGVATIGILAAAL
jgi:protein involved in polysaccharide export with SLBB domain